VQAEPIAWIIILYGLAASVLPVWLLLAPRDYLSTFMKLGTIFALALGIFFVLPDLNGEETGAAKLAIPCTFNSAQRTEARPLASDLNRPRHDWSQCRIQYIVLGHDPDRPSRGDE